jgi:hypothetical protein
MDRQDTKTRRTVKNLEAYACLYLNCPRSSGAEDLPEINIVDVGYRTAQIGVIEGVEQVVLI